ncbi:hypothetical protein IQ277_29520 [Nostocales cyanobacterium LEGE 12452]|nr:hypothetical protein [Nostocales cyanobacterium LEGE 12452]
MSGLSDTPLLISPLFKCTELFQKSNISPISLSRYANHLDVIKKATESDVFQHRDVVSIQIAGYEVLGKLFSEFVNAILHDSKKAKLICNMLPQEYRPNPDEDTYNKILKITDYISGMTDSYATSLFQHVSGISLG